MILFTSNIRIIVCNKWLSRKVSCWVIVTEVNYLQQFTSRSFTFINFSSLLIALPERLILSPKIMNIPTATGGYGIWDNQRAEKVNFRFHCSYSCWNLEMSLWRRLCMETYTVQYLFRFGTLLHVVITSWLHNVIDRGPRQRYQQQVLKLIHLWHLKDNIF